MTIKETVKQALTQVAGNKPIAIDELWMIVTEPQGEAGLIMNHQIKRALRDITYVRKLADGRYVVKGRKVPPKVDITQPPIDEYGYCDNCNTSLRPNEDRLCSACAYNGI